MNRSRRNERLRKQDLESIQKILKKKKANKNASVWRMMEIRMGCKKGRERQKNVIDINYI